MVSWSEFCQLVRFWYIIAIAYIQMYLRKVRSKLFPNKNPPEVWSIKKALMFRDEHDDFEDITSWFIPDEHWKEDIQAAHPDWEDWRVELRCTYAGRKCRIVLRKDDELYWPPRVTPNLHHVHNMRAPQGILSATLLGAPGTDAKNMDITRRAQKYAGFGNEYHGTTVRVRDLFPMDDHDDNKERFTGVRIIDLSAQSGLSVKTYYYEPNDIINDPNHKNKSS